MKKTAILLAFIAIAGCASLNDTNRMLKPYVGKPIDSFLRERAFAADGITPMKNGGAIYGFSGGPDGPRCRFFIVTDERGIILSYRYESC